MYSERRLSAIFSPLLWVTTVRGQRSSVLIKRKPSMKILWKRIAVAGVLTSASCGDNHVAFEVAVWLGLRVRGFLRVGDTWEIVSLSFDSGVLGYAGGQIVAKSRRHPESILPILHISAASGIHSCYILVSITRMCLLLFIRCPWCCGWMGSGCISQGAATCLLTLCWSQLCCCFWSVLRYNYVYVSE